jgi:serine/threonine-protein kinase
MILAGQLADDEAVRRFQTEAEAAAKLDHPNIVPIYEIGEANGQHFFSMGFVEGRSLAERLREGPLGNRAAAEMILAVAQAVQYAHEAGVVHRDLKPGNVLLKPLRTATSPDAALHDTARGTKSTTLGVASSAAAPALGAIPMLTDFGLAKLQRGQDEVTSTGRVMGTPAYMPPEQAAGQTDRVGPRSDV